MLLLGVVTWMGLVGCSSESSQFSPEQIIDQSLKEVDSTVNYYAEAELTYADIENQAETMVMKEWRKDGKARIEMTSKDEDDKAISVLNGEMSMTYAVNEKKAYFFEEAELLELNQPSLKDQANFILNLIGDTHDISIEGEAEVVGRDTFHIVAKEKEKGSLFGDQELWIDKENWMVLKMISTSGDSQSESIYTKLDFDMDISDEMFSLDLPDDVEMINLNDFNDTSEVSLEEATSRLGKSFLYFTENDQLKIASIEKSELTGEINRVEIDMNYTKNELPLLTLSLFETSEDIGDLDLVQGEEPVTIRGQEGSYMEIGDTRTLFWQEDGMSYSIIIIDPNLTMDELKQMVEDMELTET